VNEQALEIRRRTREFGLRVIRLDRSLPRDVVANTRGKQLLRSATSVGTNYRAAGRTRSSAKFRAKLGICEEQADESIYWIELLVDANLVPQEKVELLLSEANEVLATIVASIKTSRRN
jgi:four helix bundle protein